MKLRFWI